MQSVVGRRVFVGSVVGGLPLIAGVGAVVHARRDESPGQDVDHTHAAGGDVDPLAVHLFTQMARTHNRMQAGLRGEDARAFAAALRTLAVHGRTRGVDAQITATLRGAVAREGRHALSVRELDLENVRREVEEYGLALRSGWQTRFIGADARRRAQAIDRVLAAGVTPTFDRVADLLDRAAILLDRRAGTVARVTLRQDAEWWAGFCEQLRKEIEEGQDVMTVFCGLFGIFGIYMKYPCVAVALAYFGLSVVEILNC